MKVTQTKEQKDRAESFYYGFISSFILMLLLGLLVIGSLNTTDIEIYTPKNIYYINGLQVTNENNNEVLNFKDQQSLKTYISRKTADDTNPYK